MLVPQKAQLWRMVQYIGLPLVLLLLWDFAIVAAFKLLHWEWVGTKNLPLALYGSVIGILVGFRNNSAYARWWEGRQLWGQIVNNSRSLARQAVSTPRPRQPADFAECHALKALQTQIVLYQIAFVHALRQQLRGLPPWDELERLLPDAEIESLRPEQNVPLALQQRIGHMLRTAQDRGWLDPIAWQALDRNLDDLADAQGGAERIRNTPMPKQYDFFPQLFVQIYCLLLPIGMVESLGWFTPLGSSLVGFMFLALDKIGRDLENPFDNKIFDVPMTAICRTIEMNLRQLLGQVSYPPLEQPIQGVLW